MFNHDKLLAVVFFFIIGFLAGCNTNQEESVQKQLFDFNWKFQTGDISSAFDLDFNDYQWRDIDLPHDWSQDGTSDLQNTMKVEGDMLPAGTAWYRKKFSIPFNWQSKRVSVFFEGIGLNSEVFINGTSLGVDPDGNTSLHYDLTPHLDYQKKNIIAVHVNDSGQNNSSGIYRHVWLIVTEPVYFGE